MGFNLKRFLRRISPEMLRQYLDARKISLSDRVDWEDPAHIQPDVLLGAITALVQFDREIVITDFENVELLCDIVGQRALIPLPQGMRVSFPFSNPRTAM